MAEPEPEPGQTCYETHAASPGTDCAWPLWGTLNWWEKEAWRKQEAVQAWRERVAPLEGGSIWTKTDTS